MNDVNGTTEQVNKTPKIVFDGNEYAADDLSQKAKNILGFLKRADESLPNCATHWTKLILLVNKHCRFEYCVKGKRD